MPRIVLLALLATLGCATHADRAREIRGAFHSGNSTQAIARIDAAAKKNDKDADVLALDRATVLMSEGRTKEAEAIFRQVRDSFDAKEGKDAGEEVKAMLLDDQHRAYAGEDYEKVMVRVMLSICNLMNGGGDAYAYALQANEKQQAIINNSKCKTPDGNNLKANYKLVPVSPYLMAALKEETHTAQDDVIRNLELVAKWNPSFAPIQQDLERAKHGHHSKPGHGVVYVFAMVGEGPYKEEAAEVVSQVSLLIADRLITAMGKQSLPPTIAPIKVPVVRKPFQQFHNIQVSMNGTDLGSTQTIVDVSEMAYEQSQETLPDAVARAVVRRVVKKGMIYGTKEAIKTNQNAWASVALDVAGVAWEATESADTRCWSLLPGQIQVLRLELPVGEHKLDFMDRATGYKTGINMLGGAKLKVDNARNTYVLVTGANGKVVVSGKQ